MFFDIHTHLQKVIPSLAIRSLYDNFDYSSKPGYFSLGIHPWYINNAWLKDFDDVVHFAQQKNVLAIGECGLDKICTTDFVLQQEVFVRQIELANQLQKPIIIHCVKAWQETIFLLKKYSKTTVIFHGFNKNIQLAKQLLDAGYYISFGEALHQKGIREVLKMIPTNRIFFETDDSNFTIEQIYKLAMEALQINIDLLSLQLLENVQQVFEIDV